MHLERHPAEMGVVSHASGAEMALVVAEVVRCCVALQAVVDFADRSSGIQLESRLVFRCRLRLAAEQHLKDAVTDFINRLVDCFGTLMDNAAHCFSFFVVGNLAGAPAPRIIDNIKNI